MSLNKLILLMFYSTKSNCPYFVSVKRKPTKSSKKFPCLHCLEACIVCKQGVWKYNMQKHYKNTHPTYEEPIMEETEKKNVFSSK